MTTEAPMLEIAELICEAGGADLHACMQCGTCTGICPWAAVEQFSPRALLRQASLGLEGWEAELVWRCVTCRACEDRCPRALAITEIMRSARAVLQDAGAAPRALGAPLASLRLHGNPWEGDRAEVDAWTRALDLPPWDEACESLFFACCTQVHDARNRRASQSLVALLRHAGFPFGVLSTELTCCGDQARKVGAEELFLELETANQSALRAHHVTRAFASSPHCLHIQQRNASATSFEHATQLLHRLVEQKRLEPTVPYVARVTYHDPCYLGRYAGIYDPPRALLTSIPGLTLVEMPRNRGDSFCCGGGGGGLWQEIPVEQRFAVHRVREAIDTGASVIATACPYCILMFEDAIKVLELEHAIAVCDVAELLAHAVGVSPYAAPSAPGGTAP